MPDINSQIANAFARIRERRPLIHQITNLVVMNDTANVTLHVGALPVMAHAPEEVAEMTGMADALVLNIGTLTPAWVDSMRLAGHAANARGIPIVLDPVGAGATRLRTETGLRLLRELKIAVVRGNAGEIGALSGAGGLVRGVESVEGVQDPVAVAQAMARRWRTVVVISGRRDVLADGERVLGVDNGHRWLTTLTGTGCMATTVIAAFAAVEPDPLIAAAGGMACFGLAAEQAAQEARGPASFKVALFDALYHLTPERLAQGARVVELAQKG
ncbi:MAG TPA: hydroxyethylthiazole kinase [Chloroflexi bacterium]|nr:hydroxyethylthiazole kinase [Chloroflexota bacterium]